MSIGKLIRHPGLPPIRRLPPNPFPANSPAPSKLNTGNKVRILVQEEDHNAAQKKG